MKGPILRAYARRIFHNGAARTLEELVNFYNERVQINLTTQQRSDLAAFLNAL